MRSFKLYTTPIKSHLLSSLLPSIHSDKSTLFKILFRQMFRPKRSSSEEPDNLPTKPKDSIGILTALAHGPILSYSCLGVMQTHISLSGCSVLLLYHQVAYSRIIARRPFPCLHTVFQGRLSFPLNSFP